MVPAGWLGAPEGQGGGDLGFSPGSRKPEEAGFFLADGAPVLEGVQDLDSQLTESSNGSEPQSVDDSGIEAAQSEPSPEPLQTAEQPGEEASAED